MEIELKYSMPASLNGEILFKNERILCSLVEDNRKRLEMKAVYMDTKDMILRKNHITYRIRKEGNLFAATVKWKGRTEGNLHIRNEINKAIGRETEERDCFVPDLKILKDEYIGKKIYELAGEETLEPIMRVEVIRDRCSIKEKDSIIELAVDDGFVEAKGKRTPVYELELELIQGEEADLLNLGNEIKKMYNLVPKKESKFEEGLILLGGKNQEDYS